MEGGLQFTMKEKKKRHKEKPVSEKIRKPKNHKNGRPTTPPKTREIGPKIIKMSKNYVGKQVECIEIPKTGSNLPTDTPSDILEQDTPITKNLIINETKEIFSLSTDSPITIVLNGITIKIDFRSLKISTNELPADEVLPFIEKMFKQLVESLRFMENSKTEECPSHN
jgi:hypothetical protein